MKLTRVHIIKAATCGGLLDGLDVGLRGTPAGAEQFDPLCLVGPNGAGKSQFLQVIAEAFQTVFHACVQDEERAKSNEDLQFEIEYLNVLFLLDEPESHFNPQWRVRFISRLLDLPTASGRRREAGVAAAEQDCLLTTHSPFVPSDMARENVLIFKKTEAGVEVRRPGIETFGTTFDTILEECFDVRPPMSEVPRREIADLMQSKDRQAIKAGIARLGDSVEKVFLMDRLRELTHQEGA